MADVKQQTKFEYQRLLVKANEASKYIKQVKEEGANLARRVPIELLALEWLNDIDASIETRAYLVENFLPILVLGCEKVLKEANRRDLVRENKNDLNYNPLNYLAQFLMRNNPKYNNQNETSSYLHTIRQIYQELREKMFAYQDNKLAKIKADVRQKREEREKQERLKQIEKERRKYKADTIFYKFNLTGHGRLELTILHTMLQMYQTQVNTLADFMQVFAKINFSNYPSFCYAQDKLYLVKRLMKNEFVTTIMSISEGLPSEGYDFFIDFLNENTAYFLLRANRHRFNKILYKLFDLLDFPKTGLLVRKRILNVLTKFHKQFASYEENFRNPFRWPVVDPFIKFENDDFAYDLPEDVDLEAEKKVEEQRVTFDNADIIEEGNENQAPSPTDLNKNDDKAADGDLQENYISEQAEETSNVQQVSSEKKVTKTNKKNNSHITKEEEILFIKGGNMYYTPLTEPLNAFDKQLIDNENMTHDTLKFNLDFVNADQFVNIINNFSLSSTLRSEVVVNKFVNYLKDYYIETRKEKELKLANIAEVKLKQANDEKFTKIFEKLDNEGSGLLDLTTISSLLERFKDGMYRELIHNVTNALKDDILAVEKSLPSNKIQIYRDEFVKYLSKLIFLVQSPMFADQMCQFLYNAVQFDYSQRMRGEYRKHWLAELRIIGETSTINFDALYKNLFLSLLKDAENHGEGKNINAFVALLEKFDNDEVGLRYHASTPSEAKNLLGKQLNEKLTSIGLEAIETGQMIQVNRSSNEVENTIVMLPLKYKRNRTYGIVAIEIAHDHANKAQFQDHDLKFYQGVARTFSKSYASIIFKNRLIKSCFSAIEWLQRRCENIQEYNLFFVEKVNHEKAAGSNNGQAASNLPAELNDISVIVKPIIKSSKAIVDLSDKSILNTTSSGDNDIEVYIGQHVYECAVNSESAVGYFNKEPVYCYSLRNEEHKSVFVLELLPKFNKNTSELDDTLNVTEVETVLYILHKCQEELLEESLIGETKNQYAFEEIYEQDKAEILFEKKFTDYVLEQLAKQLDTEIDDISEFINHILQLVSCLLKMPELLEEKTVSQSLLDKMRNCDPTTTGFKFSRCATPVNLDDENVLSELHKIRLQITDTHKSCSLLVDWLCLIKKLHDKTLKMKRN